jgi:hypothetical protein
MKNMKDGQCLSEFLLEEPLVAGIGPAQNSIDGKWIGAFLKQLALVLDRLGRIHAKSTGGILGLQEKIRRDWNDRQGGDASGPAAAQAGAATPAQR